MFGHMTDRSRATSSVLATSILGAIGITAYAAFGALQILVLNPLAVAPGLSLGQIHARMEVANESLATSWVLTWMGSGVGLGAFMLLLTLRRNPTRSGSIATTLLVLAFGAPAYWIASFPAGMSLADTFLTSGGDRAPWALVLYLVSAASIAGLAVTGLPGLRASKGDRSDALVHSYAPRF